MTNLQGYLEAFSHYMRSGDPARLIEYCEDPTQQRLLAVYRNGFFRNCVDALMANYPICVHLLGAQYFKQAARAYVDQYPPRQGMLVGYGEDFSSFLSMLPAQDPGKWQGMPTPMADIAKLDLAWLRSLMSADTQRALSSDYVAAQTEQGRDIADTAVKLNPSVRFCHLEHSVFEVWVSVKNDSQTDRQLVVPANPQTVMFWRLRGVVQARTLSSTEHALMRKLQRSDGSLGEAIEEALALEPDFAISEVFSGCLQNELLELEGVI